MSIFRYSTAIFILLFSLEVAKAQSARPNIIFILADDLGYSDLACYGNPFNETPHLDSLARSGIRFTQTYAASPVCSPSRAAILTGKYPARLHLTNFLGGERTDPASPILPADWQRHLPASEVTMAEHLKKLNYATGMVGKWHLGGADSLAPWSQGFDYTRMIGKNSLDYYNYSIHEDGFQKEKVDKGTTYLTDQLTDYAVDFVNTHTKQPFFLYLAYSVPHVYIVPRGDKVSKYLNKYEKYEGRYNPYYGAMLESLDDGIGRIIQTLRQQNLLENTLIVFTSDNGGLSLAELGPTPTSAGVLRNWKGFVYEGGIRVPTLISWKGTIAPQRTCQTYFTNTDYLPTLLDVLQQPLPKGIDGKSFYPLLKDSASTWQRGPIYWHYPHYSNQRSRPAAAVLDGDFKLVENYETGQTELYNLKTDISEKTDLSKQLPDKAKQLMKLLTNWRKSVRANMPRNNPKVHSSQ